MSKPTNPVPLYPTYNELVKLELNEYPQLTELLNQQTWHRSHWLWGQAFLKYVGRNKSSHTYDRFRNDVERFLLWTMLVKKSPVDTLKKANILEYADFCWRPPVNWICLHNYEKFRYSNGYFKVNDKWAPFRLSIPKDAAKNVTIDKKKYQPSQQTLKAMFTAISSFYKYLMNEDHASGNPAQIARIDCRHFIRDSQIKEVKRLTEDQWRYVYQVTFELASKDRKHERSLFIISSLKTLFLRISELSVRANWNPVMSHFWEDSDSNWWLKIYGKGRKIRDITVPASFIPFLKRYRLHRGLSALPSSSEQAPIVEKIRGQGGMTSRQLSRIVQTIFDKAYEKMCLDLGESAARKLKQASSHWLRHTGASMEIERGRALKDLSEDLGHASMATTDSIYVQTESKIRAQSGKNRKVK